LQTQPAPISRPHCHVHLWFVSDYCPFGYSDKFAFSPLIWYGSMLGCFAFMTLDHLLFYVLCVGESYCIGIDRLDSSIFGLLGRRGLVLVDRSREEHS